MEITYFIDDKLGGIASLNYNIINNKLPETGRQKVVLMDLLESTFTRARMQFNADEQVPFTYSSRDNLYGTMKRLRQCLPSGPGSIVLNDQFEMEMLDHYLVGQTAFQIVHDEYNFKLALQFGHVVDVFIAHSHFFYEALIRDMPDRRDRIFYLPHGVTIPSRFRQPVSDSRPVRLLFLGRMSTNKGIFDLPMITGWLREWNIPYTFTCIGNGPELDNLKKAWKEDLNISFLSPATNKEVTDICSEHDLFVFPTRFEGTPVSLLETMSTGLVPVITDLPGGIREIVSEDIGFRIPMGESRLFAEKIRDLAGNRSLLDQLSINSRNKIIQGFDVKRTAAAYHKLFSDPARYYHPKKIQKKKIGARLDQPYLPSVITKLLRSK